MRMMATAILAMTGAMVCAAPVSQDDGGLASLWNQIRVGKVQADHVAMIGDYEYEVFVDRGASPPVVILKRSDKPLADLAATKLVGDLAAEPGTQQKMLAEYQQLLVMGHGPNSKRSATGAAQKSLRPVGTENSAAYGRLWQQVQDGEAQHDHIATIGKYRYLVYIDRTTSPITILIKHTEEALADLFDIKNVDTFDETLDRQDRLVEEYRNSLVPGSVGSTSKKESRDRTQVKEDHAPLRPTGEGTPPGYFYGCEDFYAKEYRIKPYRLGPVNDVFIDAEGRPSQSWVSWEIVPFSLTVNTDCRKEVGRWGIGGDVGGHAIAAQNGGWGSRANFTPQNGDLNNGEWKRLENLVKYCAKQGYFPVTFTTGIYYQDILGVTLRPDLYSALMVATKPVCPVKTQTSSARVENHVPDTDDQVSVDTMVTTMRKFCAGKMIAMPPVEACTAAK